MAADSMGYSTGAWQEDRLIPAAIGADLVPPAQLCWRPHRRPAAGQLWPLSPGASPLPVLLPQGPAPWHQMSAAGPPWLLQPATGSPHMVAWPQAGGVCPFPGRKAAQVAKGHARVRLLPGQQLGRAASQSQRGSGFRSEAEWWFLEAMARPLQQTGPDSSLTRAAKPLCGSCLVTGGTCMELMGCVPNPVLLLLLLPSMVQSWTCARLSENVGRTASFDATKIACMGYQSWCAGCQTSQP